VADHLAFVDTMRMLAKPPFHWLTPQTIRARAVVARRRRIGSYRVKRIQANVLALDVWE
jgi:hypothetical protein